MHRSQLLIARNLRRGVLYLIALLSIALSGAPVASAKGRVALVIGNSNYEHTSSLANPENDARLIAAKLRLTGFDVIERANLSQHEMRRAFADYTSRLQSFGADAVGLIFYAGHGVQVNGQNYILPVDARIRKEADVEVEAINASILMRSIALVGNKLNIIILDACRNNPYRSAFRSAARGLARMDAPIGSLVAFSTAPGMVAADGRGSNSPYSESLAQAIETPGLKIEDMFKRVRNDVFKQTGGAQVPWESSSIFRDFYFAQSAASQTGNGAPRPAASQAAQAWSTIQSTTSQAVLKAFISQFPKSVYASFAAAKLNELRQTKADKAAPALSSVAGQERARQPPPPPDNKFRALLASGAEAIERGVRWDVYLARKDADGKRKHVAYSTDPIARFKLKDGQYFVTARYGDATASRKIIVRPDQAWGHHFILNAGQLRLTGSLAKDSPTLKKNVRWDVYHAELDEDDKRKHVAYGTTWRGKFVLPAGRYYVTLRHGDASAAREIQVQAGKLQRVPFVLDAGRLTLTAALATDTPTLKSAVRWDVYDAELDEDDRRKHITYSTSWRARFVLDAGRYYLTARHGSAMVAREVTVEPGKRQRMLLPLDAGRLILTAALTQEKPPLKSGVRWDVYEIETNEDGNRKHVTYATSWRAKFALPAGRYMVAATHGATRRNYELTVGPGKTATRQLALNAGRVKLIGRATNGAELKSGIRWDVYAAKADFEGKRRHITYATSVRPILTLAEGSYRIVLTHNRIRTPTEVAVRAGDIRELAISLR